MKITVRNNELGYPGISAGVLFLGNCRFLYIMVRPRQGLGGVYVMVQKIEPSNRGIELQGAQLKEQPFCTLPIFLSSGYVLTVSSFDKCK